MTCPDCHGRDHHEDDCLTFQVDLGIITPRERQVRKEVSRQELIERVGLSGVFAGHANRLQGEIGALGISATYAAQRARELHDAIEASGAMKLEEWQKAIVDAQRSVRESRLRSGIGLGRKLTAVAPDEINVGDLITARGGKAFMDDEVIGRVTGFEMRLHDGPIVHVTGLTG